MSGQNGNDFAFQGANEDILISEVNETYGAEGLGTVDFWSSPVGQAVFRDSITQEGGLDYPNGYYDIFATRGATYEYKGRLEKRTFESQGGEILIGPAKCQRIDGPSILMDAVRGTGRRRRKLEAAISGDFRLWADHLPLRQIIGLMVNGRVSPKHTVLSGTNYVYTRGTAFFATDHRVNPMDETNAAVFSNKISLGGTWTEARWATAKQTILETPDMDGQTLRNAGGMGPMVAMVGTVTQAQRLARIFGTQGASPINWHVEVGTAGAAVNGVVVGELEIIVNPYLITMAEAANLSVVQGRTYIFPNGRQRKPFIFREEMAPTIDRTGPDSLLKHTNNAEAMYIQAACDTIWGDPRGLIACDES